MQRDHQNVLVLGTCQMLTGTGRGLFMVTAPAVGLASAPHLALVTLPTGLIVIGNALAAMPASLMMRRFGRKTGFIFGTFLAIASGLSSTTAVIFQDFWLLAFGGFLNAFAPAFDVREAFAGRSISVFVDGQLGCSFGCN